MMLSVFLWGPLGQLCQSKPDRKSKNGVATGKCQPTTIKPSFFGHLFCHIWLKLATTKPSHPGKNDFIQAILR